MILQSMPNDVFTETTKEYRGNDEVSGEDSVIPHKSFVIPYESSVIPHKSFVIPYESSVIPYLVRNLFQLRHSVFSTESNMSKS